MQFDVEQFRQHFPYLQQNQTTSYLDSAATSLKPQALIDATVAFYQSAGSVHRSQYDEQQTYLYEQARQRCADFIGAESPQAIIWTSGTTQAINTVAYGLLPQLQADDEIIISEADHHANFVTWSAIAKKCGAKLIILSLQENWLIDPQQLKQALTSRTKIVALNYISNVTGTEQPLNQLIPIIRAHSQAFILVDAAQAISHKPINLAELDADFLAFSAHKLYGPTGLGVLSGKLSSLNVLQPLCYGGKMIEKVSKQHIRFAPLPYKLEAGTPNIAAVIGFNAVLAWLAQFDLHQAEQHSIALAQQIKNKLAQYPACRLFNSPQPSTVVCFIFEHIHCADLATLLAEQKIALRSGEHCAQPYLARLGQSATLRLSLAPYNHQQDIERFFIALEKSLQLLEEV